MSSLRSETKMQVNAAIMRLLNKRSTTSGKLAELLQKADATKTRIPADSGTTKFRVPDILSDNELIEIKNVKRQSMTRQIRDFLTYSQRTNRRMILYVRLDTKISGPLRNAVLSGAIDLRNLSKLFEEATRQKIGKEMRPMVLAALARSTKGIANDT